MEIEENLCRFCLSNVDLYFFLDDPALHLITLAEKHLNLKLDDNLSAKSRICTRRICTRCYDQLVDFAKFYEFVHSVQEKLAPIQVDETEYPVEALEEEEEINEDCPVEVVTVEEETNEPLNAATSESENIFIDQPDDLVFSNRQKCRLCHPPKILLSRKALQEHRLIEHPEKFASFRCTERGCDAVLGSKSALQRHIAGLHQDPAPKPIAICESCGVVFKSEELKKHVCHQKIRHVCDACGVECFDLSEYKRHMFSDHLQRSENQCNECLRSFEKAIQLRNHIESVHGDVDFVCSLCKPKLVKFPNQAGFKRHLRKFHRDREEEDAPFLMIERLKKAKK